MTFAYPWVLTLLVAPLLLIAWERGRTGARVAMPFDHAARHAARRWTRRALFAADVLPALGLAVVVVVVAGPKRAGPPGDERVLTNIEICLDVSGSMAARMSGAPGAGRRYEVAMAAIQEFTEAREGDAFGLTIFGGEVVRWAPLTKDIAAIRSAPAFLDPAKLPPHMNSTLIASALRFCAQTLSREDEGDRLIVLVSDGVSYDLFDGGASEVGSELAALGVVVYAIHIGESSASEALHAVVAPTGGDVMTAHDAEGLRTVFRHIDRMRPVRRRPGRAEQVDFFGPFAAAGLALLGLHQMALFGMRHTPW